jgi:LysR family transcriptional regulator, glycine cleavage system transcriptional activator
MNSGKKNPPLNSLRAFAAVGQTLSVGKAAAELRVTHSAVSQQVKLLEEYLGVKLLERSKAKISLTDIGNKYAADLNNAFNQLRLATEQVLAAENNIITINMLTTFAMRWLIPRLSAFQEQYPQLEVRLSTPGRRVDFKTESIDLAIYYGEGPWPKLHSDFLFHEYLLPVCSPALVKKYKKLTPEQMIATCKLIQVKTEERKDAWAIWLEQMQLPKPSAAQYIYFQNSLQAIEAAINGIGIAMAPELFVLEDLAAQRLVKLMEDSVKSPSSFYLVCPESHIQQKKIQYFRDWILQQEISEAQK